MTETNLKSDTQGASNTAAADMYHDPQKALDWALRLETMSWIPLVLAALALIYLLLELYIYIPQVLGSPFVDAVLAIGIPVLLPLAAAVVCLSFFALMRAVSQTLLAVLDIQEGPGAS